MNLAITPVDLPADPFVPFADLVRGHAAAFSAKLALQEGDIRLTWAELAIRMDRQAAVLQGLGFGPGDVLGLLGDSSVPYFVAFLAALAAGGCVAPLPVMATDTALATMIADSGARILAAEGAMRERCAALLAHPRLTGIRRLGLDFASPGWPGLDERGASAGPAVRLPVQPDTLFNIIYSSGTTGVPKGIVHDHLFRYRQLRRMREFGLDETRTQLLATAPYSNTTLVGALATLGNGGSLILLRRFSTAAFLDLAERARPTHTTLVPVLVQRLLADPRFDTADLSSLAATIVTSAPLAPEVKRRVLARWPGGFYEMYGQTEGGLTSMLDTRRHPGKLASVGLPSATADVRIISPAGTEVAPGEIGEVVGRSPTVMCGYHGRPDLTEQALIRLGNGQVYLRTGDLGRFDADGFLHLAGRAKDVIISGGYNIYATDLEEALLTHPAVLEAAVTGVPSADWGETPVGFVVLQAGADAPAEGLRTHANARLGKVQRLSEVRIVDSLPRNALGKVLKPELLALWHSGNPEGHQ